MSTRIQHRAICSACGRQQAVDAGGFIADHGFTIEWGSRNGRCLGSRHLHFGTPGGRDFRAELAGSIAAQAIGFRNTAKAYEDGTLIPNLYDSRKQRIENPMPWQIKQAIERLLHKADSYLGEAKRMTATVDEWKEIFPVEVLVETRDAPLLHGYSDRWGGGKLCAASARARHAGHFTKDDSKVTCPKCLKIIERLRAEGKR